MHCRQTVPRRAHWGEILGPKTLKLQFLWVILALTVKWKGVKTRVVSFTGDGSSYLIFSRTDKVQWMTRDGTGETGHSGVFLSRGWTWFSTASQDRGTSVPAIHSFWNLWGVPEPASTGRWRVFPGGAVAWLTRSGSSKCEDPRAGAECRVWPVQKRTSTEVWLCILALCVTCGRWPVTTEIVNLTNTNHAVYSSINPLHSQKEMEK